MTSNIASTVADATAQTTARMTPVFLTRIGGLPFDVADQLSSPLSAASVAVVTRQRRLMEEAATELSDAIAQTIGGMEDRQLRGALIRARRDIHNEREPRSADVTALTSVSGTLNALHAHWLRLRDSVEAAEREAEQAAATDQAGARKRLRELSQDEEFLKALMLASPSLFQQLRRAPAKSDAAPSNKKERAVERALTRYALRAATKTSPFSSLTPVVRGELGTAQDSLCIAGLGGVTRRHTRLNVAVLARISELIKSSSTLAPDLPVQIVSDVARDAQRVRYVRRQRNKGDDSAVVTLDGMQENLFYLASGRHLARVIALAATPITIRELESALAAETVDGDTELVTRFVRQLVRLGLLEVPSLAVPLQEPDPVLAFADSLRTFGTLWGADLAGRLEEIAGSVREFATADVTRRDALLDLLRDEIASILTDLGGDGETVSNLIYEDATLPEASVGGDTEVWNRELLAGLSRITRILPVFDGLLSHQILLKDFFRLRFGQSGECNDILRFVHDFHLDIYDEFARTAANTPQPEADGTVPDRTNWLDSNQVRGLDVARRRVVAGMRERLAAQGDPEDVLVLDDEFFDEVASELPDLGEQIDPRSYFLQVTGDASQRLVLNKSYTGLGLLFSRFSHCFEDDDESLSARVAEELSTAAPPGAVLAEMSGGIDTSNLNLHAITTDYQLVCPGDPHVLPRERRIAVEELSIRHNPMSDRLELYCARLDRVVIPVYHGFLLPLALPDLQRVLLLFSYTRLAQLDLWSGTDQPLGDRVLASHPRVVYGDIVVVRKTWKADPAGLVRRSGYASESAWFRAWQAWRDENRLPRRVFASLPVGPEEQSATDASPEGPGAAFGGGKPQYIDFESFHCLQLLEDMLAEAPGRIVFVEMLPDREALWEGPDGRCWVAEQTMESLTQHREGIA